MRPKARKLVLICLPCVALSAAEGSVEEPPSLQLEVGDVSSGVTAAVHVRVSRHPESLVLSYRSVGDVGVSEFDLFGDGRLVYRQLDGRDGRTLISEQSVQLSARDVVAAVEYCAVAGLLETDEKGLEEKYEGRLGYVSHGAAVDLTLVLEEYSGIAREEPDPFIHGVAFDRPGRGDRYPELRALITIGNALADAFRSRKALE